MWVFDYKRKFVAKKRNKTDQAYSQCNQGFEKNLQYLTEFLFPPISYLNIILYRELLLCSLEPDLFLWLTNKRLYQMRMCYHLTLGNGVLKEVAVWMSKITAKQFVFLILSTVTSSLKKKNTILKLLADAIARSCLFPSQCRSQIRFGRSVFV